MTGQRPQMLVVDVQVRHRGRRREFRRRVEPEPVDHELVQRLERLDCDPGVFVKKLLESALASRLLETAVTEEASARALHPSLIPVADSPSAPMLVSRMAWDFAPSLR